MLQPQPWETDHVDDIIKEEAKGNKVIPDLEHTGVDKVVDPDGVSSSAKERPPADDEAIETDEDSPEEPETQFGESTSKTGRPVPPEK